MTSGISVGCLTVIALDPLFNHASRKAGSGAAESERASAAKDERAGGAACAQAEDLQGFPSADIRVVGPRRW